MLKEELYKSHKNYDLCDFKVRPPGGKYWFTFKAGITRFEIDVPSIMHRKRNAQHLKGLPDPTTFEIQIFGPVRFEKRAAKKKKKRKTKK